MPKSKIFKMDYAVKSLAIVLRSWARHRDMNPTEIGRAMGFSANTWFLRMRNPANLTVVEMWKAINALKIPPDEAAALMTAGIESLNTK